MDCPFEHRRRNLAVLVPDVRDLRDSHGRAAPHASHNPGRTLRSGMFCPIRFQVSQNRLLDLRIQFKRLSEMIFELIHDFFPGSGGQQFRLIGKMTGATCSLYAGLVTVSDHLRDDHRHGVFHVACCGLPHDQQRGGAESRWRQRSVRLHRRSFFLPAWNAQPPFTGRNVHPPFDFIAFPFPVMLLMPLSKFSLYF